VRPVIARSEAIGYEAATVGGALAVEIRNNARVILDDAGLAAELWARARPLMPQVGGREAVGLNPRLRFYRYDVGEGVRPALRRELLAGRRHREPADVHGLPERRMRGRRDELLRTGRHAPAGGPARAGQALVFAHLPCTRGRRHGGRKYALRTDVMYGQ
jgi:hypothetical protein